jgi:hypothetical protein
MSFDSFTGPQNPDGDSTKHVVQIPVTPIFQREEIDPCDVPLPDSDDEGSYVPHVVEMGEQKTDGEADKDVQPLSVAGRNSVPEIAKVGSQNSSHAFPD